MNNVQIIGNLTAAPELRTTPGGHSVCSFSLAVSEKRKIASTGEWIDEVSFFECTAWGRRGEVIHEHHQKGDRIAVFGKLKQDRWDDKETGKARSKVKVMVDGFTFVKRDKGEQSNNPRPIKEEEIPF